ncbi:hypothetical protein AAFF_G00404270 [Aldrovandia affinis]|uniref:Uncharacterized protein n=1 Tax=Aldrovandia affinis TaxID=143900 RepID=A0AAD7T7V7_9TELE|nr:hypothetical protein AAFF_G00404270 [Aldrovandia affinis]
MNSLKQSPDAQQFLTTVTFAQTAGLQSDQRTTEEHGQKPIYHVAMTQTWREEAAVATEPQSTGWAGVEPCLAEVQFHPAMCSINLCELVPSNWPGEEQDLVYGLGSAVL